MRGQHSQPILSLLGQGCMHVTCYLHIWQNGQDLLRDTAVTWGGTDTECESAQNVNTGEENFPLSPAGT